MPGTEVAAKDFSNEDLEGNPNYKQKRACVKVDIKMVVTWQLKCYYSTWLDSSFRSKAPLGQITFDCIIPLNPSSFFFQILFSSPLLHPLVRNDKQSNTKSDKNFKVQHGLGVNHLTL